MKLWILRPIKGKKDWKPWHHKAFGHVVRAEDETEARERASIYHGDEGQDAWINNKKSTCIELTAEGEARHIIRDFASA